MARYLAVGVAISLILFGSLSWAQQIDYRATLNQYCVSCHNDTLLTAGLSLQQIDVNDIGVGAETWEKVLRKLNARTMPPSGMPRPDNTTYDVFANYLEDSLDTFANANPRPGIPIIRRINRTEYINAVRDLLAVEIHDDAILPADDTMFGFDNIGDVLTLSPTLTEQYIAAARKVRRHALCDPETQAVFDIYTVSPNLMQEERMGEDLPFGSRGGVAIRHHFPQDGEYILQVRLQLNSREYIRGLAEPHQIDIRLDDERIQDFTIGGEKHGRSSFIFSTASIGDLEQERYERTADRILDVKFPAKAGTRLISVSFLDESTIPEEPLFPRQTSYDYAQYKGGLPGVYTVAIGGPYNAKGIGETASRRKILSCQPSAADSESCARQILSDLAHRAYKRPPTEKEVNQLMGLYRHAADSGFEAGIGLAIERILAGPEFLFVVERTPANLTADQIFKISDMELATQLSLFLWSSLPDDELLLVAESGHLSDPKVLRQQVQRMLDDPRSEALVKNYAAQWLQLRNLNAAAPNDDLFPYFDDNLLQAFQKETELFFNYNLRNGRPLLELLDANYTFLNSRLARFYDIPNIHGSHFRKVTLPEGTRGGILGQGSILTLTSYPNRTAPTIRGKWILVNILGAPPPPPPANIPSLRNKNDDGKVLNMRQQMEQHSANPVCAACHKVMDPLGFALENYDAIGKWRAIDATSGSPIDTSGVLPDGTAFVGLQGLRKALMGKRQEDFVLTVIEKLLTYSLGRGVDYHEMPVMRDIMRQTEPDDYRLAAMIMAIVESTPFQMRRAASHDDL
jgi:hypothetical protein